MSRTLYGWDALHTCHICAGCIDTLRLLATLATLRCAIRGFTAFLLMRIGTAGIEPAQWLFPCFFCQDRSYRVKATLLKSVLLPITRPCGKAPNALRSDMRHIPKGAPYFCIARPLHFRISHSTRFLVAHRRRIRLFLSSTPVVWLIFSGYTGQPPP